MVVTKPKESEENKLPESLSAKKSDFPEWMSQVLHLAGVIDNRYEIKSMFVWMPYGYDAMLRIKAIWDNQFKTNDIKEMYFPLMVPVHYAEQNASWWDGFKNEGWWAGQKDKQEYIIRPTGEPAMYPMFSLWIRGLNDLPLRIYETVFSYRYETKQTRPLIRDREIGPWYEIHTCHATKEEAEKEIELARKMNDVIWEKIAVKPLLVRKPKWECFPGAEGALEYYTLMPSGKVMENGSLNHLGQAYSKKFNITFRDSDGKEKFVWQTCTGNGERYLSALIAEHGDDSGLVMPPEIAPIQINIVLISRDKNKAMLLKEAENLRTHLKNFRVSIDTRDISPGKKFYDSEIKGIPLRIDMGEKELKEGKLSLAVRHNQSKISIDLKDAPKKIEKILNSIQEEMLAKSQKKNKESIVSVATKDKILSVVNSGKIAHIYWCESPKCFDEIKASGDGLDLIGSDLDKHQEGKCIACGKNTANKALVGNSY